MDPEPMEVPLPPPYLLDHITYVDPTVQVHVQVELLWEVAKDPGQYPTDAVQLLLGH
jgi:hypothetical protein